MAVEQAPGYLVRKDTCRGIRRDHILQSSQQLREDGMEGHRMWHCPGIHLACQWGGPPCREIPQTGPHHCGTLVRHLQLVQHLHRQGPVHSLENNHGLEGYVRHHHVVRIIRFRARYHSL